MATDARFDNPLFIDIAPELSKVDDKFTELLKDREKWSDFISNPTGVMSELGIIPPIPKDQTRKANQIFYACLNNSELVSYVLDLYSDIDKAASAEQVDFHNQGLREGRIRNLENHELGLLSDLIDRPDDLNKIFNLTLHDLNSRGVLHRKYEDNEINEFIDETISALKNKKAIVDLPKLNIENELYYAQPLGAVVGPVALAVAVAQVGVAATVAAAVAPPEIGSFDDLAKNAFSGDIESAQALSIMGRLFDLTADLLLYVQGLENKNK